MRALRQLSEGTTLVGPGSISDLGGEVPVDLYVVRRAHLARTEARRETGLGSVGREIWLHRDVDRGWTLYAIHSLAKGRRLEESGAVPVCRAI